MTGPRQPTPPRRPRRSESSTLAPGVVDIRLTGAPEDLAAVASRIGGLFDVVKQSGQYANDGGRAMRVYITIRRDSSE